MGTGPNVPMPQAAVDWAIRDTMPKWAKQMLAHRDCNIIERTARRTAVWSIINGINAASGPAPEFQQAQTRVRGGTAVPHTLPAYVLGSDQVRSRSEVERSFQTL
jgi:hypothetical protein